MDLLLQSALPLSVNLNCYATKVATNINLRENYWKPPWFNETSRFESLCRYSEIQVFQRSQRVKMERDLH